MQHGEALSADVDPERPLSEQGRSTVAAVAAHASACGVRLDRIVHSGKLRAEQTAAILAAELACADVGAVPGLAPNDDVRAAASVHADPGQQGSLAVVGHLPFLDRFASLLVAGDAAAHVVAFRNGGLVRLEPSAVEGRFCVAWAVTPEVARG